MLKSCCLRATEALAVALPARKVRSHHPHADFICLHNAVTTTSYCIGDRNRFLIDIHTRICRLFDLPKNATEPPRSRGVYLIITPRDRPKAIYI